MYKRGVSIRATSTLNKNPEISNPVNISQGSVFVIHNKKTTVKVSINCDEKVEKLFLIITPFKIISIK